MSENQILNIGEFDDDPLGLFEHLQQIENKEIVEKYIYKPDLTKVGTIEVCVNRKRFFSKENKINDILPSICTEFWERVLATLESIECANYK